MKDNDANRDYAKFVSLLIQIPVGLILLVIANVLYFRVNHEAMAFLYDLILYSVFGILIRTTQNIAYKKGGKEKPYNRLRDFF